MERLVCVLLTIALSGLLPVAAQSQQSPTDADWNWVASVEKSVFDALMPLKLEPRQVVAYRSGHDFMGLGEIERHFTLSHGTGAADFSASVVVPEGRSIQRQLLDLHIANRTAPLDEILAKISVSRATFGLHVCPALRQRMRALADISITLPFGDWTTERIFFHPISHRLVVRTDSLTLDAEDFDEKSALVRWALRTNDDLIGCAARRQSPSD